MENVRYNLANEVMSIMDIYRKQEARGNVDTPGGLENMGDVWSWFKVWDRKLREEAVNG